MSPSFKPLPTDRQWRLSREARIEFGSLRVVEQLDAHSALLPLSVFAVLHSIHSPPSSSLQKSKMLSLETSEPLTIGVLDLASCLLEDDKKVKVTSSTSSLGSISLCTSVLSHMLQDLIFTTRYSGLALTCLTPPGCLGDDPLPGEAYWTPLCLLHKNKNKILHIHQKNCFCWSYQYNKCYTPNMYIVCINTK